MGRVASDEIARLCCDGEQDDASEVLHECSPASPGDADQTSSCVGEDEGLMHRTGLAACSPSYLSELEGLRQLHLQQRKGLSIARRPLSTAGYFLSSVGDQIGSTGSQLAENKVLGGASLLFILVLSVSVALDYPNPMVVHSLLAYLSFIAWWIILGILSSIGVVTGLQTFLLYLGPHIASFTLKATACGRTDIKSAPYDTALWGASNSWSSRACVEFGEPTYDHFPGDHGGYYAVPLLHLLLAVLPEAMLWGAGAAIGELPPYLVARAARLSGERAREVDELMEDTASTAEQPEDGSEDGENENENENENEEAEEEEGKEGKEESMRMKCRDGETRRRGRRRGRGRGRGMGRGREEENETQGGWLYSFYRRAKLWLLSQGRQLSFSTIVVLAAIPNPLFDFAGLTCGHFLVPVWKFFCATLIGKSLFKAPSQALVVALLFNAHSIELLEDALDAFPQEHMPAMGASLLPWLTTALDSARQRIEGRPQAVEVGNSDSMSISLSVVWSSFVVLMFCVFLGSIMTSTAKDYLVHQQRKDLLRLQQQHLQLAHNSKPKLQEERGTVEVKQKGGWEKRRVTPLPEVPHGLPQRNPQ